MSPLRNLCHFPLILITCLQLCCAAPFLNSLQLPSFSNALERMADYGSSIANYGYSMLGYNHVEHDYDIVPDKQTLWDGHIAVPDLISPLLGQLETADGERVVQGHDTRLGFRAAIPYLGDFQYVREMGPGRFVDKLGPGKYEYPGLSGRPSKDNQGYSPPHTPYSPPHTPYSPPAPIYNNHQHETVYPKKMYQGLQNYPWSV